MKHLIKKHPILLFCIANIITSVFMVSCFSFNDIPQWSPALYAIIITAFIKGKTGICELFNRLSFRKEFVKWYIISFFLPISLCGLSYITFSYIENGRIIPLLINHSTYDYLLILLLILLGSIGEEIGWRAFMLPRLRKRYSLFRSSVIIGLFWGI